MTYLDCPYYLNCFDLRHSDRLRCFQNSVILPYHSFTLYNRYADSWGSQSQRIVHFQYLYCYWHVQKRAKLQKSSKFHPSRYHYCNLHHVYHSRLIMGYHGLSDQRVIFHLLVDWNFWLLDPPSQYQSLRVGTLPLTDLMPLWASWCFVPSQSPFWILLILFTTLNPHHWCQYLVPVA